MSKKLNRLQHAHELLRKGQYQQASEIFNALKHTLDDERELFEAASLGNHLGQRETALLLYKQIINQPNMSPRANLAHHAMGNIYREIDSLQDAALHYEEAIKINPRYLPTYMRLGNVYRVLRSNRDGIEIYRKGLEVRKNSSLHTRILLAMHYMTDFSPSEIAHEHRLWGRLYCQKVEYDNPKHNLALDRKIRIGYVSGDLRLHSVSYFLIPLLASRNREKFEAICYSTGSITDETTAYIKQLSDGFREIIDVSDKDAYELIKRDEIDILFDLSGHTPKNRLSLFAMKPAPLQITYIGYPDTTGMEAIDYRIVDRLTDPLLTAKSYNVETPLYLPRCFLCFNALDKEGITAESMPPYQKVGIVTYGCFNEYVKITDEVILVWAAILKRVPGSRLLLKTKEFAKTNVQQRVRDLFALKGIIDNRIIFLGRTPSRADHLKLYDSVDIALDTFPYNGTTTTFQALSMGVPVVTFEGDCHVSRVSYSILSHIGCGELAGKSIDEYIIIAAELGSDPERIVQYKKQLRAKMNRTVSDEHLFMKGFEDVLRKAWIQKRRQLKKQRGDSLLHLGAVGDVILARRVHYMYEAVGLASLLGPTLELLASNDLNLCNLETVVSDEGGFHPKGESNPYYFRCSSLLADLLREVPFHVAVHGNNHAMDFGESGLRFQQSALQRLGLASCGSGLSIDEASKPAYVRMGSLTVAIISFSCVRPKTIGATESKAGVFLIHDPADIAQKLKSIIWEAKIKAHLVIVSPHWNENWESTPRQSIRQQAHILIEMGCDAILGHSSHLLQGIEVYQGKPIVYDMGTFIVDAISGHVDIKYSALFSLQVDEDKGIVGLEIFPLELTGESIIRAQGAAYTWVKQRVFSLEDNGLNAIEWSESGDSLHFALGHDACITPPTQEASVLQFELLLQPDPHPFKPDVLLETIPPWCNDTLPVLLGGKVEFRCIKTPEAFMVGAGFAVETVFYCRERLKGNYVIHLQGRCKTYDSEFNEFHPCSNGIYNPTCWKEGDLIADRICVRPSRKIKPGKYNLYIGIKELSSGQYLRDPHGEKITKIEGASIYVLPNGISPLASGIDWDGRLQESLKEQFEDQFYVHPERFLFSWIRSNLLQQPGPDQDFALHGFALKYHFNSVCSTVYISLLQEGLERLRWGCIRPTLQKAITRSLEMIKAHRRFVLFDFSGNKPLIIELEMVTEGKRVKLSQASFTDKMTTHDDHQITVEEIIE